MPTRLAMVACFGPHVGPWLRARGNETGIKVKCLGDGEKVIAVYEDGSDLLKELDISAEGEHPIPKFTRIRFRKEGGLKPTSVELTVAA
jgi:hypothetical protein